MSVHNARPEHLVRDAAATVGVAAALLTSIAVLARGIDRLAVEIEAVLRRLRDDTEAISDLANVNAGLERLTNELRNQRTVGET
jgi:putative heme degradation protein